MTITAAQLRTLAPGASTPIINGIFENQHFLDDAGINTPLRICHFLAQAATETGGFKRLEENLNYTAKRLCQVWPKRFPTVAAAQPYAGKPEKLANKVYGGRLGNSNAGDGWTYRGSGILQTTGKTNFADVGKQTGMPIVANPEMLRTFPGALQAACIYWRKNGINKLADADDVVAVTHAVNGGENGLADRKAWLKKAKKVWSGTGSLASARQPIAAVPPAPVAPIVPAPAPVPAPATSKEIILGVQKKLTELSYNPGGADGLIGPLTKGAIMAFKNDHKLPLSDVIDDDFLRAIDTAAPREMVAARANATVSQVAAVVPEVRHNWLSKITAGGLGGTAGAGVLVDGVLKNVTDAKSTVNEFTDYLAGVPGWGWCLIILAVAGFIYWKSQQSENASVAAFQSGDRR